MNLQADIFIKAVLKVAIFFADNPFRISHLKYEVVALSLFWHGFLKGKNVLCTELFI
jgi:hypothetical protein